MLLDSRVCPRRDGLKLHPAGMTTPRPEPSLLRLADERDQGIRSQQYREAKRGQLHRLAPGTYVSAQSWAALGADEQYLLRVEAAMGRVQADEVLSHWSAAAVWRLPIIGPWPSTTHVTAPVGAARRSTTVLTRHRRSLALSPAVVDEKRATSLAETVVDIARVAPFAVAVAMGDAALRRHEQTNPAMLDVEAFRRKLENVAHSATERRGCARARAVLDVIDGRADRPGESLSRATMIHMGVPLPELQHRVVGPTGAVYFLDFYWPEQNIGADFDGKFKYLDPAFRGGRTADQVVYDEKVREDEVRLELNGYGRWDWTVAGSPTLLAQRLRRIGLRW